MAGKGEGEGTGTTTLDPQITSIKYTLFFFNVIIWIIAAAVFGLTMWLRFEPGIDEWVTQLNVPQFYIGVYILIISSIMVMVVSFVGCGSALIENQFALTIFIVTQALCFVFGLAGSAVLLEYSTYDSSIQPIIRENIKQLIIASGHHEPSKQILNMVQENIGCCGADGPNDYLKWQQPISSTCRDSVTGNAFFYGCVDELTWFFEEKAGWVAALAMTICFMHVINGVLTIVLKQLLQREEDIHNPQRIPQYQR